MPRVLVVDDQSHVRATVAVALRAKGFDVAACESARMCLLELEKSRFDLAIVDIVMPEMDGVKLIRELRERYPEIAVIAMSGAFLPSSGRAVLDILPAANDLSKIIRLKKPFRSNELLSAVQAALSIAA
jgi:CheY-like chemotaxis protein